MPTMRADVLERFTREIFVAWGVPENDAAWVATLLVRANLRGHDSHGVIRIIQYVKSMKIGETNPRPTIRIERETPTTAVIDGDLGLGQLVAHHGIELAIDKARTHGVAAVTLKRTNHIGRLADYGEIAAAQGLITVLWANIPTSPNVAPWGGAARRLGTNPHAVIVPGPDKRVAMTLDFATSIVTQGKLQVKRNRGEPCPPGVMLDGAGRPSTDPEDYYGDPPGSLLPFGEHKGFGLGLAVDILGGILSGAGRARPGRGPVRNGVLMVCLDVEHFMPAAQFHAEVADLFAFVRSAPLAQGATEILIPGEPEERTERHRSEQGIPIEEETWRQIQDCARERGLLV